MTSRFTLGISLHSVQDALDWPTGPRTIAWRTMTYREFATPDGRIWEAWEVRPIEIERRINDDRRQQPRFSADRRSTELQFRLRGSLREGWLTFQSGEEKRRVCPIPSGWTELPDSGLISLLDRAERFGAAGRVVPSRGAESSTPRELPRDTMS